MYYRSRSDAGQVLAQRLFESYRYENCAVVAMSEGAVSVGEQIATSLHAVLTLMLTEEIQIPGEGVSFGAVSQEGGFTFNSSLTEGQKQGYISEFHGYLEEQKRMSFQRINRLLGDGGVMSRDLLRDRVVILVSDGLNSSSAFDVAVDFLKPIRIRRLIVASPTASVDVVDKLHIAADELHILDVKSNFMGVDHYYENNDLPPLEETISRINQIVLNWT